MKKLLLINVIQPTFLDQKKGNPENGMPPLALGYLAAYTPPGWEIEIVDENVDVYQGQDADLVGISSMTKNAARAYKLCLEFRERGITTIMGGIHASMMVEEAKQYCDSVVTGEAEFIWEEVIRDFEQNKLKDEYNAVAGPLDNLKIPRRDLFSDKYSVEAILTTRGCPMNCDFCSVTLFNGGKYRYRPINEVLDELETLNGPAAFFIDDNIVGHGKRAEERAISLFKGIIERNIKIHWSGQASINIADNDTVLEYASKSGCRHLLIGIESVNTAALEGYNKNENLRSGVEKYKEKIDKLHSYGIGVMGSFIFGSDFDDKDCFEMTGKFVMESGMDSSNFSIMTPFPGTKLYKKLMDEKRIVKTNYPDDWQYYTLSNHVTYIPKKMTPKELLTGTLNTFKKCNSFSASFKRGLNTFSSTKSLFSTALSFVWNRGGYKANVNLIQDTLSRLESEE